MATSATPLSDPLFRLGRVWFRWRSLSPVPFFLLMIFFRPEFEWQGIGWALPLMGVFLGEALRLWAVGYAGSATRTRGDTIPALVHAGPYRWIRNPLYVANIVLYSCAAVLFGYIQLTLILFIYSCIQYTFIVHYEETLLHQLFGESYADYQSSVSKWVPVHPPYPKSEHLFDLNKAIRSERSTFISMGALLTALLVKHYFL